jgi:hypothetical protein
MGRLPLFFLIPALLLAFVDVRTCAAGDTLDQTIESLLLKVEKSPCTFIRNGSNHTGKEAAAHMRRKYNYYRKEIHTTRDFIEKCGTKSELSGKLYYVQCSGGPRVRCDEWLAGLLKESSPKPPEQRNGP